MMRGAYQGEFMSNIAYVSGFILLQKDGGSHFFWKRTMPNF